MSRPVSPRPSLVSIIALLRRLRIRLAHPWQAVVLTAGLILGVGCGHDIGDSCRVSSDCDPTGGTRICDVSQPGGYCIVEGCDEYSCPGNSACIRLFPASFLSKPCDPTATTGNAGAAGAGDTGCAPDELCLDIGQCVLRSLEHRECLATCGNDGDCRGGYECRLAGNKGSMPLLRDGAGSVRFCAPL